MKFKKTTCREKKKPLEEEDKEIKNNGCYR